MSECKKTSCNVCSTTYCGCGKLKSTKCIAYDGNDLPCIGSTKGDRIEDVIEKIDTAICGLESQSGGSSSTNYFPYRAWADDASGTGFTLTPSDKCFYAVTNTVATVGSPVVSDFTGKWFRINQPKTIFEDFNYMNIRTDVITPSGTGGAITPFDSPAPKISVPIEFFDNGDSYIEYELTFYNYTAEASPGIGDQTLHIELAGTQRQLTILQARNQGTMVLRLRIYYTSSTTVNLISEHITPDSHASEVDTNLITLMYNVSETVAPGSTFDIQLVGYSNTTQSLGYFDLVAQKVKAYNKNKITP